MKEEKVTDYIYRNQKPYSPLDNLSVKDIQYIRENSPIGSELWKDSSNRLANEQEAFYNNYK